MLHTSQAEADLHIHALGDDVLGIVLKRVLACPSVLVEPAALAARRSHLTGSFPGSQRELPSPATLRERTAAWRSALACIDLPGVVRDVPLWSTSRLADALYKSTVTAEPVTRCKLVCKRWRTLLSAMIKVVLCGVKDHPPPSTEVLVLLCDWNSEDPNARQLDHLTALPRLRVLIVWDWCSHESDASPSRRCLAPPPLPSPLPALQHLVFFNQPSPYPCSEPGTDHVALLQSIAPFQDLRTLVLPRSMQNVLSPDVDSEERAALVHLLLTLTKLETLHAQQLVLGGLMTDIVTALTALRSLSVCTDATTRATLEREDAETTIESSAPQEDSLGGLATDLEEVHVTHRDIDASAGSVASLSRLMRLTRLTLDNYSCDEGTVAQVAAIPSLAALTLHLPPRARPEAMCEEYAYGWPHRLSSDELHMLTALTNLTELHMDGYLVHDAGPIGSLSALKSLQIGPIQLKSFTHNNSMRPLGRLSCLEHLKLYKTIITQRRAWSLARLRTLKRLNLYRCVVKDNDGLDFIRKRTRLQELSVFCYYPGSTPLQPLLDGSDKGLHPCLTSLSFTLTTTKDENKEQPWPPERGCKSLLQCLWKLPALQELTLQSFTVSDADLRLVARHTELRRLALRRCTGWSAVGLQSLRACRKLEAVDTLSCPRVEGWQGLPALPFTFLSE